MDYIPVIVLTGGPGGGKTTQLLIGCGNCARLSRRGERWMLVPEAAPPLFQAGLDSRQQSFQRAVARLQIALEETCEEAAEPQQVLLCHRGTLDALAYSSAQWLG